MVFLSLLNRTPLHCAASCNNLAMVKFLVEHGACIFAATLSDQETAAEKCEEDEEGFDGCSEYLYSKSNFNNFFFLFDVVIEGERKNPIFTIFLFCLFERYPREIGHFKWRPSLSRLRLRSSEFG